MRDAQPAANGAGIFNVIQGAAALVVCRKVGLVQAVQLHGNAYDLVALLMEQQGGHRRVHAAAHSDSNFFCHINRYL